MSREGDLLKYYKTPPDIMPATYPPIPQEEMDRRVSELNKKVAENVERIQNSAEFRNFLITMSHFHTYSWNNTMLILLQKPGATHVAGYNTWVALGRQVKGGEKGISILAPRGRTGAVTWRRATNGATFEIRKTEKGWGIYDSNDNLVEEFKSHLEAVQRLKGWGCLEERYVIEVRHFKPVAVFDISQTTGKPLPEFEVPVLTGGAKEELFSKVMTLAKDQGLTVSFEPRPYLGPSTKGEYSGKSIWVKPEESRAQQLKSLLHEVAHYYSEGVFRIPRRDAETIAESAAYIVGAHYGFDSGVRSFPYIALWSQDYKIFHQNMASIQDVAEKIITTLEQRTTRLMPQVR